ncbi:Hypothetical predicted protein [Prunus dulcis]|uniref:Uncharacterized protein n=1 Tax=Prunus dulcis TaxID=3755 RepID=A0A5E4GKV8_PRUDU|nr:hypothetical protein L3X38_024862 [Prunus dulcis]VVA38796.1 Hypothetical predicted protein [Prunus dulcis]VVA40188.1 Hypothetical predicted protein [Prunus dulcis]
MAPNLTNQKRFDWIDQQLGELVGLLDTLQDLSVKVEALEGLDERVTVNKLTKDFQATVECGVHCPTTIEGIETNRIEAVGENKAARTKNPRPGFRSNPYRASH